MREAFAMQCKSVSYFFNKNIAIFNILTFEITNDVVSFEQVDPEWQNRQVLLSILINTTNSQFSLSPSRISQTTDISK